MTASILLSVFGALLLQSGHVLGASPNWSVVPSLPVAVGSGSLVSAPCRGSTASTCVYSVGGLTETANGLAEVDMLGGPASSWTAVSPLATGRAQLAVAAGPCTTDLTKTCIYAIGGVDSTDAFLQSVEMYSPYAGTWTAVQPVPTPGAPPTFPGRAQLAAAAAPCFTDLSETCVYAVGGYNPGLYTLNSVEMFNPASGAWSTAASLKVARSRLAAAAGPCSGNIAKTCVFAIGGTGSTGFLGSVEMFDPVADSWSQVAPLHAQGSSSSIEVAGQAAAGAPCAGQTQHMCLYAFGGQDQTFSVLASAMMYDPGSDAWTYTSPMMTARDNFGGASAPCVDQTQDSCLFAVGGSGSDYIQAAETFDAGEPPIPLLISGSNAAVAYGGNMPELTFTATGFVDGDTAASLTSQPTCQTTATTNAQGKVTSPVGAYAVTCSGAVDAKYSIAYSAGTLTVSPAPLTVTASSPTSVYGQAIPSILPLYSGLVAPDTAPATVPNCSTSAKAGSVAGTYTTVCSGGSDPNYTFNYFHGSLTINPASLTVTAGSPTSVYGQAVPAIVPGYSGLVPPDSAPATVPSCSTSAKSGSGAGNYPTNCSGASDPNYRISYVPGTLTINPAGLSVTASSPTSVYGQSVPPILPLYSGLVPPDSAPSTTPSCSTVAKSRSAAGTYATSCSGGSDPNYHLSYTPGVLTINRTGLTVTASDGASVYGQAVPSILPMYLGLVSPDTAPSTAPTCSTAAKSGSGAGAYPTTCSGGSDPNYSLSYLPGRLTINPAPLTVTAGSPSVVYGQPIPSIVPMYSGLVAPDSGPASPPTCGTSATSGSGAGTYTTTCSGATDPNYRMSYATGTLTIKPAPLTVTASSPTMVHGQPIPSIAPDYAGLIPPDSSPATPPSCSTAAGSASGAGTYVTTCSAASDPNYRISYATGTLTIKPAPLTVTASSPTMVYGQSIPSISPNYSGLVPPDAAPSIAPACSSPAKSGSGAGTYSTTCAGASDPNYQISYVSGLLTIKPAPLIVTASSSTTVYGQSIPSISANYSGLVPPDAAPSIAPTCSTPAKLGSGAGAYSTTCSGASDPNYHISYVSGTLTIKAAALTVTASSPIIVYGQSIPPISADYSGLVSPDSAPQSPPDCSTSAKPGNGVGNYATTCTGAADPNYHISYVSGVLTIKQAPLAITASSPATMYGQSIPSISADYSGLVLPDTAPSTPPVCSTSAKSGSGAGDYATNCSGASDPNYHVSYVSGILKIKPAPLTITASSPTMVYGESIRSISPNYSGLVPPDAAPSTAPNCSSSAKAGSGAGTYATTCSGATDPNYHISYVPGGLTIKPAQLSITASSPTSVFGQPIPSISAEYTGLVSPDTAPANAPTCSSSAKSASAVGTYTTICSGASDPNYEISYSAGMLTIKPAPLTVTASSPTMVYGQPIPSISAEYSGLVSPDTAPAIAPTCSSSAQSGSGAGTYATTCSGAIDPNYHISYTGGTLTVHRAPLLIRADNLSVIYGHQLPPMGWNARFVAGDTSASLSTQPLCTSTVQVSTNGSVLSPAGRYSVTCAGAVAANYHPTYAPGHITIALAHFALRYAGPASLRHGRSAVLFGFLSHAGSGPVVGRSVRMILGSGNLRQACTTKPSNSHGYVSCMIGNVKQAVSKVELKMKFQGDPPGGEYDYGPAMEKVSISIKR